MLLNNNRLPYAYITKLLNDLRNSPSFEWLTRNIVNKAFIKYKSQLESEKTKKSSERQRPTGTIVGMNIEVEASTADTAILSELSGDVPSKVENASSNRPKGGRHVGTTIKAKEETERKIFLAKNIITKRFSAERKRIHWEKNVKCGTLKKITDEVKGELKLNKNVNISPSAIRQRYYRKKEVCHHVAGHISPLEKIEPTVISIIIHMGRIRQSLSPSQGLRLVNSLIKGTEIEKELVQWKQKFSNNNSPSVGNGYWARFMKRNKDKIVSRRGQRYELNRQKWTTYSNFVHMYNHCINEMVDAGVAVKLDDPVWMNRAGKECSEEEAFGCKVTHKIIRPDMCICGDEVGGNLSMKGDGNEGGKLLLGERGCVAQEKASTRSRKFTMIGFTALTGDPVMCVLIFEGKKPNGAIEAGIDITVTPDGTASDPNFVEINSGPGKYFPGGPVCEFRGKKVPAVIRWHESASITSEILVEVFQTMDHHDLFPRSHGVKPFVLIDGHGSRLEMPFLTYVNNPKDNWVVCIGVPYGTALWQVGDSKEQNGSFNMALTKAKLKMLETREKLGLDELQSTDLMPIINYAWNHSFARRDKNKNAISDRGWNPLNRKLLTDNDLRATMTQKEKSREHHKVNNIILPSRFFNNHSSSESGTISSTSCSAFSIPGSTSNQSTINTNQQPSLNFSTGTAQSCLDAIVKDADLQMARERIKENLIKGKAIKEQLKEHSRITSGIVFKCNTTRLGQTVFDACKDNQLKKKEDERAKMLKQKEEHIKMVQKAKEILAKKPNIETMTIKELTLICKPLKTKSDGKMPVKKQELIEAYIAWKNRPPLVFEEENSSSDDDDIVAAIPVEAATNNDTGTGSDIDDEDEEKNDPQISLVEI